MSVCIGCGLRVDEDGVLVVDLEGAPAEAVYPGEDPANQGLRCGPNGLWAPPEHDSVHVHNDNDAVGVYTGPRTMTPVVEGGYSFAYVDPDNTTVSTVSFTPTGPRSWNGLVYCSGYFETTPAADDDFEVGILIKRTDTAGGLTERRVELGGTSNKVGKWKFRGGIMMGIRPSSGLLLPDVTYTVEVRPIIAVSGGSLIVSKVAVEAHLAAVTDRAYE
jgi:hypothetical protein